MNATPRQKVLLGILGFLLVFALWQTFGPSDDGGTAPPPAAVELEDQEDGPARPQLPGSRRSRQRETVEEVTVLRVADLDIQARDYAPGRDPWRYYEPPPPGPSPEELARQRAEAERLRLLEEQRRREAEQRQAEMLAQQPPPEPPVPQPPPFPYKYLGNFGPPGRQIAVFSDGEGKTIINRRQGDVIDGKFVVAQIGYESVDIQFVGFPNTPAQRLPVGR
ncbi:MAG TPA: hypothetical protein VEL74_09660 [Thermoanaerobaculia bacterium]|nr:hypothetical protein [Thermoanaerobaculia bacterium]